MTAATRLKHLAIAVAALVVAGFVTLVGLSFVIPAATVRDAVKKEIKTVTGLDPMLRGAVSVSLFPHATVSFRDVLLGDGSRARPAVAADELIARLRYFPLLAGHIEIADVTLVRPTIDVNFSAGGQSNWSGLITSLAHAVEPNARSGLADAAPFSEIGIHDATIRVRDAARHVNEELDDAEFEVAWPSISRSFAANGHFVWHGQTVDASLTLSDFLAALTGQRSGVKLHLASAPLDLAFEGAASDRRALKMDGTLSVESPSLRDAILWTGKRRLPFGGFGRFALRAHSQLDSAGVSLTNVDVDLDGNKADGVLTFATDTHRAVEGTLAAGSLDLTPYVSGFRLVARDDEDSWDRLPIALDGLSDFNLDLRLSAGSVKIGDAKLGRTAVAANMRGGKLHVTIGESQAFGGVATGSFGLGSAHGDLVDDLLAGGGVAASSHVEFAGVDLARCLGHLFGLHKLEGRGTLTLDISGSGNSVWGITHTLNGTASLKAHDGALAGINVEQLLRRLEKRPLSGNGDYRTGRTPFKELALNMKIEHGMVSVEHLNVDSPAVHLAITGRASVPSRDLDLHGKATLVSSAKTGEFDLPFAVQGQWDDPIVLPDASSLIRHSGAAAPLLEAVKRHSAGEAVRSIIDQLFGSSPGATAAPAAKTTPAPATAASTSAPAH